jgi:hypothetical protein
MKICVAIMKLVSPQRERERMEARAAVSRATAHAEDLSYTTEKLCNGGLRTAGNILRSLNFHPEKL